VRRRETLSAAVAAAELAASSAGDTPSGVRIAVYSVVGSKLPRCDLAGSESPQLEHLRFRGLPFRGDLRSVA
jgi:hypothetical protein